MKRIILVLLITMILIMIGCSKNDKNLFSNSAETNDTATLIAPSLNSPLNNHELQLQEEMTVMDEEQFENGVPCKSISIVQISGENYYRLIIGTNDEEQFSLSLAEQETPHTFNELILTDLDNDGSEEIVTVMNQDKFFEAIYIINVKKKMFMSIPHLTEEGFQIGINYDVLAVDENHAQIKNNDYVELIDLSYSDILKWNYSEEMDMSQEEYLSRYSEGENSKIGYAAEAGIGSIEAIKYAGIQCLKFRQPLYSCWGRTDILGYIDTILSWDDTNTFHIEDRQYVKYIN